MDFTWIDGATIPAVVAYTAMILRFAPQLTKFGILVSIGSGILYAFTMRPSQSDWIGNLITGTLLGLLATGGFSGAKNAVQGMNGTLSGLTSLLRKK